MPGPLEPASPRGAPYPAEGRGFRGVNPQRIAPVASDNAIRLRNAEIPATVRGEVSPNTCPSVGFVATVKEGHQAQAADLLTAWGYAYRVESNPRGDIPAAACHACGGWTSVGGMSGHHLSCTPVLGRTGCHCRGPRS